MFLGQATIATHEAPNSCDTRRCRTDSTQKTHMIGLWPPAPGHETDVAASPSTAQYRGAGGMKIGNAPPDAMNTIRPRAAGFEVGAV